MKYYSLAWSGQALLLRLPDLANENTEFNNIWF
jgi:hypothetical protein